MKTIVVNARFAGIQATGVQRSAQEIVSRLIIDDPDRYALVSPRFYPKHPRPSLQVKQCGYFRHGHLWEQVELPRIVQGMGRDAILYSPSTSGPLAVSRQVMTVHDLFPIENPEWFSRAFSSWYRWLMPRLLKRVAYVLANSRYTRERVLERYGLPPEKVILCHFAHSERFAPAPSERLVRFRTEQDLSERYLLYLGPIDRRKNVATLVAAWKRTRARERGIKLVIAGGVAPRKIFNTSNSGAEDLNDPTIQALDYVPDEHLPLLYGGAEVFVFPSLAEGFGLPVLEAMACGTPVICSDSTAMPEIAGGAACLVPALEVEAWTEMIDSVFFDSALRERMRTAGLKRASEFTWKDTADTVRKALAMV
jgi:glycosyltransferase involved in cell wall biosynthesis